MAEKPQVIDHVGSWANWNASGHAGTCYVGNGSSNGHADVGVSVKVNGRVSDLVSAVLVIAHGRVSDLVSAVLVIAHGRVSDSLSAVLVIANGRVWDLLSAVSDWASGHLLHALVVQCCEEIWKQLK